MIEAANGKIYTGITTDVEKRFEEHKSSKKKAKFFRTTTPKKIVYQEKHPTKSSALIREHQIKKLTRLQKLQLINHSH